METSSLTHAVTFSQPYAELLVSGEKLVDNRNWIPGTKFLNQWIAIHAGSSFDGDDTYGLYERAEYELREPETYVSGAIVGCARLIGWAKRLEGDEWQITGEFTDEECSDFLDDPWLAETTKAFWIFSSPIQFAQPIPCKGALRFWKLPDNVREAMLQGTGSARPDMRDTSRRNGGAPPDMRDVNKTGSARPETRDAMSRNETRELTETNDKTGSAWPETREAADRVGGAQPEKREAIEDNGDSTVKWKSVNGQFPQVHCGAAGCERPVDGYIVGLRNGKGWYGPVCVEHAGNERLISRKEVVERGGSARGVAALLDVDVDLAKKIVAWAKNESGKPREGLVHRATAAEVEVVEPDDPGLERATVVASIPRAEIDQWEKEAAQVWALAENFQVTDQASMDLAANVTALVKSNHKKINERRKEAAKPLDDAKKRVQLAFKPVLELLTNVEQRLKGAMDAGKRAIQAAQDEALGRVEQAFAQGDMHTVAAQTHVAQQSGIQLPDGAWEQSVLDFEVVDITQVPLQFFDLNPARVRQALRAGYNVPGIRKLEGTRVAVRA